jgi:glycosyltransferase involved in cell wall biosynthesis
MYAIITTRLYCHAELPIASGYPLKILQVLYFYRPHTSGLTVYAERLAKELVRRGHEVTVLTAQHDPVLPRTGDVRDGVTIHRLPVLMKIDRGVVVPRLIPAAIRLMAEADVVHLHLPLWEAAAIARIARWRKKRVIVTHHSDLQIGSSPAQRVIGEFTQWGGALGGRYADALVANSQDQAAISPTVRRSGRDVVAIPPPIEIPHPSPDARQRIRAILNIAEGPAVGFSGRYSSEKGIDVLLRTLPALRQRYGSVTCLLAGPNTDSRTGERMQGPWNDLIEQNAASVRELGYVDDQMLADIFAASDVLALPSINNTETFGMVQIEAMLCGTPVVASDLPGVRVPTRDTGMGRTAKTGDVDDLAAALIDVIDHRDRYVRPRQEIEARYALPHVVDAYERLYRGETFHE